MSSLDTIERQCSRGPKKAHVTVNSDFWTPRRVFPLEARGATLQAGGRGGGPGLGLPGQSPAGTQLCLAELHLPDHQGQHNGKCGRGEWGPCPAERRDSLAPPITELRLRRVHLLLQVRRLVGYSRGLAILFQDFNCFLCKLNLHCIRLVCGMFLCNFVLCR